MKPAASELRRDIYFAAAVFCAAFIVFSPALRNGYVFDDVAQVQKLSPPEGIGEWLSAAAQPWWPESEHKRVWRPLTQLVIKAQKGTFAAFSENTACSAHHLINLILHSIVSVLVYVLARALGYRAAYALVAGLIAAIHPMRSEAVHQIVGQAELLAAMMILIGLIHHVIWMRNMRHPNLHVLIQALIFLMAVAFKEHAILYPGFWLAVHLALRPPSCPMKWIVIPAFGFALAGGLFLLGKFLFTGGIFESLDSIPDFENPMARMEFMERIPAALGLWTYGFINFVFPHFPAPDYSAISFPLSAPRHWDLVMFGCLLLVHSFRPIRASINRGDQRPLALWICAALSILFVSNLFFNTGVLFAWRLTYLPVCFASLLVAMTVQDVSDATEKGAKRWQIIALRVSTILFLLLMAYWVAESFRFAEAWRTNRNFAETTLAVFPDSWRANHNLARESYLDKEFLDGMQYATRATELRPEAAESWDYLGLNAAFTGDANDIAEAAFLKAIEIDPELTLVYQHYANFLDMNGRYDEAEKYRTIYEERSGK